MKNMKLQAMDAMMGESKPMQMEKRPLPESPEGDMESILVTAEEKAMIMAMRDGVDAEESQEESYGMEKMVPKQMSPKMGVMG
jgi:hypothetical protein